MIDFVYIYPQIFVYIGSSEQVQTDSTRSSLKPRVFLGRHFYFRCIFGKKKKIPSPHVYRTCRTCGCAVDLPHVRFCGAASLALANLHPPRPYPTRSHMYTGPLVISTGTPRP